MKARIIIEDDSGHTLVGDVVFQSARVRQSTGKLTAKPTRVVQPSFDFSMQERAFVKRHANGLSGPRKFVLLVAYFSKGKVGQDVLLRDIEIAWNRMTAPALMAGKFNRFYSNAARVNDWVETKKSGVYSLRPSWDRAFNA